MSVLATMPSQIYSRKLERTSNADRLKFNDRSVQIDMNLIEEAIVAFVRSLVGNFRETRKLQSLETHKTLYKTARWHTRFSRDWSSDVCSSDLRHSMSARASRDEFDLAL